MGERLPLTRADGKGRPVAPAEAVIRANPDAVGLGPGDEACLIQPPWAAHSHARSHHPERLPPSGACCPVGPVDRACPHHPERAVLLVRCSRRIRHHLERIALLVRGVGRIRRNQPCAELSFIVLFVEYTAHRSVLYAPNSPPNRSSQNMGQPRHAAVRTSPPGWRSRPAPGRGRGRCPALASNIAVRRAPTHRRTKLLRGAECLICGLGFSKVQHTETASRPFFPDIGRNRALASAQSGPDMVLTICIY